MLHWTNSFVEKKVSDLSLNPSHSLWASIHWYISSVRLSLFLDFLSFIIDIIDTRWPMCGESFVLVKRSWPMCGILVKRWWLICGGGYILIKRRWPICGGSFILVQRWWLMCGGSYILVKKQWPMCGGSYNLVKKWKRELYSSLKVMTYLWGKLFSG